MDHGGGVAELVGMVAGLLLVASLVHVVTQRLRLPFSVVLVLVGIGLRALAERGPDALRHAAEQSVTPGVILFVFLPTLIFESAFGLDARQLRRNLQPILTLAVPGLVVSTVLIGFLVTAVTPISLPSALVLGAILSATDPVAVVALFRQLGAPARLTILVEGESLFNDATAIVVARILTGVALAGALSWSSVGAGAMEFATVFFGGIVVGWLLAVVVGLVLGRVRNSAFVEITLTTTLAYLSFVLAEEVLHVSGVMATVAAAVTMGSWGRAKISPAVAEYLHHFWEHVAHVANALIFLLVGLRVELHLLWESLGLLAWVVVAMLASRAVVVYGLLPLVGRLPGATSVDLRYRTVMYWGGLRGAIAIAIVLSLPSFEHSETLVVLVTGAVLFTLLVPGLTMESLVRRLGLDAPPLADRVARTETDLLAKLGARARIPELQAGGLFSERIAADLQRTCEEGIRELRDHLNALREQELDREQELRVLWLRCLAVEATACYEMFGRAHLSERAYRDLALSVRLQADGLRHVGSLPRYTLHPPGGDRLQRVALATCRAFGLAALAERLRRATVAREYEQAWGRHQGCLEVLEELEGLGKAAGVRADVLAEVRTRYEGWRAANRRRLDETAALFPEFVSTMQERLAGRLLVHAERETIQKDREAGAIPETVARPLLARLDARLSRLGGRAVASLKMDPAELLRTVPFFRDTPPDEFARVAGALRQRTEAAGNVIIRQGTKGDSLFLIARGVVRVCLERDDREHELATLLAGDFFGEMALLHGEPRTATCRAITPCALYELRREDLDAAREACPQIQRALEEAEHERRAALEQAGPTGGGRRPRDEAGE